MKKIATRMFSVFMTWFKAKKWWILILAIVGMFIIWQLGIMWGLLWLVFLSFSIFEWDSWIIAFLALIFLVSCLFLTIYKKDLLAEQAAIYAFYFLVMTVVLQIVEYVGRPKNTKDKIV